MAPVLIIGANRGLGAELAKQYAVQGETVLGTTRSSERPNSPDFPESVKWLPGVDLTKSDVGDTITGLIDAKTPLGTVVCVPDPITACQRR